MSRHTVPHPDDVEIVVGFDPPLCAFFGQRFSDDGEHVVAGHPTRHGLGVQPRLETAEDALPAVIELAKWMIAQGVEDHVAVTVAGRLSREWREERREASGPYALLRGAFEGPPTERE